MAGKKKSSSAAPSQRMLRVAELIRHRLAEMLSRSEIHDDVLAKHVITVPEVRLSPDLKLATVYIMPLGGEDTKPILDALERNKRFLRGEVANAINLKSRPSFGSVAMRPSTRPIASTSCWRPHKLSGILSQRTSDRGQRTGV